MERVPLGGGGDSARTPSSTATAPIPLPGGGSMGANTGGKLPLPITGRPRPAAATPASQEELDAKATLQALLGPMGLGSLVDWAYDQYVVQDKPLDFVVDVLLPQQQAYKDRFSANARREAKGLRVLSPYEYMAREEASRQARREAGMMAGFYDDPKDFEDIIAEDMSVAEERARYLDGYRDVAMADPEVRRGFAKLYGVQGDAALAMYFIDPARALPVLEREEMAARAFGAAVRTGFGDLNKAEAEGIASLGVSEEGFVQGFGALVEATPLFTAIDQGEDVITREEQIGAAFSGNAAARARVETRRRRRQAQFEGGGSAVTTARGFSGLGSAES